MDITHSTLIDTPPDRLWELITDLDQIKKWTPALVDEVPISEGEGRVGFLSKMHIKEGSQVVIYDSEITHYEPKKGLTIAMSGGNLGANPMHVTYTIVPEGDGSRLDYHAVWEPNGLMMRLMLPLIKRVSNQNVTQSMTLLKDLAEGSA